MTRAKPAFTGPDLCGLSACDAVKALRAGEVSASELVAASLTRINQTSPAINAMVTPCPERANTAAQRLDQTSLLAGLPIGIKDLTPVAGVRTTWGSAAFADHVPERSDPLVTRLEARGAIVMGKTNTPEMGAGANTFNAVFGATRNPWDTRMNAGGSSGGAAAGLAVGEVWLSHGSDFGGSLRTPASYCGVVGLRPTPGRVASGGGADSFDPFGVEGPMARSVSDVALFLDAMTGFDPLDPLSYPGDGFLDACQRDAGPVRVAFSDDLGQLPVTAEIRDVLTGALTRVQASDLTVTEHRPKLPGLEHAFRTLRGVSMWTKAQVTPKRVSDHFKPTLAANIAQGGTLTVDDIAQANITRARSYASMMDLFATHDVLACPVTGLAPLPVEIEYPTEIAGHPARDYLDWLGFAFLATLTGLPALSLPVGFTPSGLPVGLQLIGPPRGEARLLQIARRLEQALALSATPIDPNITH
ncbi:amidase [Sagittula marina]|uniref:Amidase n=1 Tax=Sagittula marina TaxID=943940 RepID=A0A7W6DSM1_9RHOB|nr:amidase family protein [Sagittula marina]MBB3986966.1 amidase [Sagittula marina]